jgi:lysophospholipase L1-like esterase
LISFNIKNKVIIVFLSIIFQLLFNGTIFSSGELITGYNSTIRILPLGNSITYDSRSNDTRAVGEKTSYRYPLYKLLKKAGINFTFVGSEHSGGSYLPAGYDDNAGFPGITDDQLLHLLKTGRRFQAGIDEQITAGRYLETYPADIILLHIGTNNNDLSDGTLADDIEKMLDHIDSVSTETVVILARIIDRVPNQSYVTTFNNNVETMALDRVNNPTNDAYPDKLVIVDMQNSVGIDYSIDSMGTIGNGIFGDMNDHLHPNEKGYYKMAQGWFNAISSIIDIAPVITLQPKDASVIVGQQVQFKVSASGTRPFTYQWRKNGVNIVGATDSVYQITSVENSDNNTFFSCIISNSTGNTISNNAVLKVVGEDERVKNSLQVLYTFEEEGTIVSDVSEVGTHLDLTISNISNVKKVPYGLEVISPTIIAASTSPDKIISSCTLSNEISIEAWIKPGNITQDGPSRIVTLSENESERDFTFGQNSNQYNIRLRTSTTDNNGVPSLSSSTGSLITGLTHVVYTRNSSGVAKVYINGVENSSSSLSGNFSTWDNTYSFGLANEFTTDRTWLGTYYLVAVYSRALSYDEITHNYSVGFNGFPRLLFPPTELSGTIKNDSLVLLAWKDNSNKELGYIVERKANSVDSSYIVLDTLNANTITYIDYRTKHTATYFYRVKAYNNKYISDYSDSIQVNNIVGIENDISVAQKFRLFQNYPNPFNPTTTIKYSIRTADNDNYLFVQLKVFSILGEEVAILVNKQQKPGYYNIVFNANSLSSGIYYYQIKAGSFIETKKMILIK